MNIFYLSDSYSTAAKYHCDKHVVKMILETAQILCTVRHEKGSTLTPSYRSTHKKHPSVLWVMENISHYEWLCNLGLALCEEYTSRYNKVHKSEQIIKECIYDPPNIENGSFSPPPQCMPEQYHCNDTVEAYRKYYVGEKRDFCKWKTQTPEWFTEKIKELT